MNEISYDRSKDEALLKKYAKISKVDIEKEIIDSYECHKLFRPILTDYFEEKISPDDLSTLCELMYLRLPQSSELFSLLLDGAELSWELRHNPIAAAAIIEELIKEFQ